MKNSVMNASLMVGQLDTGTVRLLLLILSLTLFVLGAGAPAGDSGHVG
jgi:hypothetical protein